MGRSRNARVLAAVVWALVLGLAPTTATRADEPGTLMVDWPGDGAAVPSSVTLSGWAVAPSSATGTGVDAVRAYLDGPADTGVALGRGNYGLTRPDVALTLRE